MGETQYVNLLEPDHFYDPTYREVFQAALNVWNRCGECDFLLMVNELDDNEKVNAIGGSAFLAELSASVASTSFGHTAVRILKEKHAQRAIKKTAKAIDNMMHDGASIEEMPAYLADRGKEIAQMIPRKTSLDMEDLINEMLEEEERIPTGFEEMDLLLEGGLIPGGLYLVAARPAVGKSSMATTLMAHFLKAGVSPLLMSLEMSRKQIMQRVLCAYYDQLASDIQPRTRELIERIETPFTITDNINSLSNIVTEMYTSEAQVVIIDYFGLITTKTHKDNRFQQMDDISRIIKNTARETEKPVIMLAQLNREIEKDKSKRQPRLSDLWGSGEKDADVISFLHDPRAAEALNAEADEIAEAVQSNDTTTEIQWIVRKNRHGATGFTTLNFDKPKFTMRDPSDIILPGHKPAPPRPKPKPPSDSSPF